MNKWSPSNVFNSTFERVNVPSPNVLCDRISESFKQSNVEFLVVIVSHGGLIDYGTKTKVRQPMFKTGCNVIYPNRYGTSLITYGNTMDMLTEIQGNLPVRRIDGLDITGEQLIESIKKTTHINQTCYRQYDAGSNVPNLEIFSSGEYFRGDGIYLCNMEDDRLIFKLNKTQIKQLKLIGIKKDLKKSSTNKKVKINNNSRFKISTKYKKKINQPLDKLLTLSDLCDTNHGTLKNLRIDGKPIPLSNTAVLVLACRNIDGTSHGVPVESPISGNYQIEPAMGFIHPVVKHEGVRFPTNEPFFVEGLEHP